MCSSRSAGLHMSMHNPSKLVADASSAFSKAAVEAVVVVVVAGKLLGFKVGVGGGLLAGRA